MTAPFLQQSQHVPGQAVPNPKLLYPICWQIEKYSYCDSQDKNLKWTHFPHRDGLHLVLDIKREAGETLNHAVLKVVWGTQLLDELDVTDLTFKTIAGDTPMSTQPAVLVLGATPRLAVKYVTANFQLRRFQVRFRQDADFDTAKRALENFNCPVRDRAPPDARLQPLAPVLVSSAVPPSVVPPSTVPPSAVPPSQASNSSASYPFPSAQAPHGGQNLHLHHYTQPAPPSSPSGSQHQLPPLTQHTHSYRPPTAHAPLPEPSQYSTADNSSSFLTPPSSSSEIRSSCTLQSDELPPPRPPPGYKPKDMRPPKASNAAAKFLDSLPPLKQPTPIQKPPTLSCRPSALPRNEHPPQTTRKTPIANGKIPDRAPGQSPPSASPSKRQVHGTECRKRKRTAEDDRQGNKDGSGATRQEEERPETEREVNERKTRQVEESIIEAIRDDEFLKLCETIKEVMEKTGLSVIGRDLFASK